MSAKVLDFYRGRARKLVNRSFERYGALPGNAVHDLIYAHIHTQKSQLGYWKDILQLSSTAEMSRIARLAVDECERLIEALEAFKSEYKEAQHDNDLPYTCI